MKNPQELYSKFKLQVDLLKLSCANFDSGQEIAGYQLATTIRVLVHDTNSSTSALTHINKKTINFLDTSFNETSNTTYLGLVYKYAANVHDGIGGEVLYKPIFTSDFHSKNKNFVLFDTWWNKVVFKNLNGTSLTRKELILKLANQEGGAHIDKKIDDKYELFSKHYSGGITIKGTKSGIVRTFDNIPILPSARQVAFELLTSFQVANL